MEEKSTEEYRDFLRNYLLLKEQVIREPDDFESFRHLIHKYGEEIPLSEMLELMDMADQRYGESSPEKLTELVEMVFEKNRYEIKVDNLIEEVKEVLKELNVNCYQHEPHRLVAFVADENHYSHRKSGDTGQFQENPCAGLLSGTGAYEGDSICGYGNSEAQ